MNIKHYLSIGSEFNSHAYDKVTEGSITLGNKDNWQHILFNEDYYLIGYFICSEWLKKHDIDIFTAIGTCMEYEEENFGEVTKIYNNSEVTANMLVYILGEQWFNDKGEAFILDLLEDKKTD